jgi:hypothetical protein
LAGTPAAGLMVGRRPGGGASWHWCSIADSSKLFVV